MLASGHVADSVFYVMVEAPFALIASTRRRYGLFFYARFRDDIFAIFDAKNGIENVRDFISQFRRRSGPFAIKLETISRHGCQMLDMFVSVGPKGKPMFSLFTKPSSIWQPLSIESCHPISIHTHWPICQCIRIAERFSDPKEALLAVDKFKKAYEEACGVSVCNKRSLVDPKQPTSWLVLPYDLSLGRAGVQRAVDSVRVPSHIGSFQRVKVSWTLANKHLEHLLRI